MYVTQEQLHKDHAEWEQRWDQKFADWLSVIRTDIENFRIIIFQEMRKESELQRFYFQQHMEEYCEKLLKKNREEFTADITRHMAALGEEYQWRLSAVGEKVDLTWEKCERKYVELDQKDTALAEKVALLEEYLPTYRRHNKGVAQLGRKDLKSKNKTDIKKKPPSNKNK